MKSTYLVKRFLPYFKKYKWILILDLFCAALTTVCELIFPLLVRFITNTAMTDLSSLTVKLVLSAALLYLILRLIDTTAYYFMANRGHVMGAAIETDMRHDLFEHLQKLSHSFYQETKVGQIMGRITSDLFDITEFAHHCPEELFIIGLKIIVSFIILLNVNVYLTLIVFAIIPIMVIAALSFRTKMRTAFKAQRVQVGELNACVEDSLLGVRVVKSFANEELELKKFDAGNDKFYEIKKYAYKFMAGFQCTTRFFDGFMYITVVAAGGIFMIKGIVNVSDVIAYLLYVSTLLVSIKTLIEFTEQFQKGMTGIERFMEIIDTPVEIKDKENAKNVSSLNGNIEFKNVSFKYADDDKYVLKNINLKIKSGENIALVGPSGGGKTTICNLIPRFYDVSEGEILIDGTNIADMKLFDLRRQIGVVQQDVYLFSGTVRENIEYGKIGAADEEIAAAARLAGAYDFISALPNGFDTYVGERGVKLSGGQKQRISIARVLLKNPPILILDEATSALDNESEKIVQDSLDVLAKGRTVLTIAHRLSTIKNADTILVLTENGIDESGTHHELLEKHGIYYNLYNI